MNNNKKLEQIMQQIDEVGLPVENVVSYLLLMQQIKDSGLNIKDVVSYLLETGRLKPDGSKILPQETSPSEYKTPSKILPGMYVYADGLIHPEFIKGRQVKAVVGYVDGSEVLAVCLKWNVLPLCSSKDFKLTADQWCRDYAKDGVKQGEAYLPSLEQLKKLYKFRDTIATTWKTLGVRFPFIGSTRSSTDKDYDYTWVLNFSDGDIYAVDKRRPCYIRPVISIKI